MREYFIHRKFVVVCHLVAEYISSSGDVKLRESLKRKQTRFTDCDENSNPFEEMSGVFQENYTRALNGNSVDCRINNQPGGSKKKRKLEETMDSTGEAMLIRGRSFLPVRGGCDVFSTEEWKSTGTSLFCPVRQDVYVNLHKYDQITAAQGSFFTADDGGNFQNSVVGHVIHLWRYDKSQRKQYVSQSFLFTNQQEFMRVQTFLQNI